jgi:uncharacterized low-complexity protein
MSKRSYKPVAAAIGGAFVATLGLSLPASADTSPFVTQALASGYLLAAEDAEGKCGEGKCGEEKAEGEGKCGEGKCGEGKTEGEGKCGEGKCGGAA